MQDVSVPTDLSEGRDVRKVLHVEWADGVGEASATEALVAEMVGPHRRVALVGSVPTSLRDALVGMGSPVAPAGAVDVVVVGGAQPDDLVAAAQRLEADGRVMVVVTNPTHADGTGRGDPDAVGLAELDAALRAAGLVRVDLRRVLAPLREGAVPQDALRGSEAETRSFVAVAMADAAAVSDLPQRAPELRTVVVAERARHRLAEEELEEEIEGLQAEVATHLDRIRDLEARERELQDHLDAILATRTFRMVAPLRSFYGRLRSR